jgi:maleate isomerase
MYGSEGRIGLAVLDSDITIEPDLARVLPEGVTLHASRVRYPHEVTLEALEAAQHDLKHAVECLLPTHPRSIVWACTSGSFFKGRRHHDKLLSDLADWSGGIPVSTASNAVIEALSTLDVKRPAVGAPYAPTVNERLYAFLLEYGFNPFPVKGLFGGVVDDMTLQSVDEGELFEFGLGLDRPEADAVVISCTGLATSGVFARLEERICKPVVTSNMAILWHACRIGGIRGPHRARGRLFAMQAYP